MEITKLMRCALCALVLAALVLVGCQKKDIYSIDAPDNLQDRIDSIAAARASMNTGDTTYLNIATAIVGPEDNSAGWWAYFSDYFTIPTNKLLVLEFVNHGTGVNNWNNWNLAVVNVPDRDAEDYAEYFVLRSDAFGWGNDDFDLGLISHNYPDTDGDEDIWNDFRTTMQGAYVTLEIDHSVTGNVYITATAVGTNDTELVMTYQQPVSATDDISAFLICDGSYFEMENAYLLPSKVTVVEDVLPVSIDFTGTPVSVELGDEDFWGDGVATVTFADGSSTVVDTADLSFTVVPDMSTLGTKTVSAAYGKTKQGEYCQPIVGSYTLEVTNVIVSISASNIDYYFTGTDDILFNPAGIVVTATYADASTAVLDNNNCSFPSTITATTGAQSIDISYEGASSTFATTSTVTLVEGVSQVGANDFSTGFWGAHSSDFTVASGTSHTFKFYCYSNGANNWNSPVTILRNIDYVTTNIEYAVTRMDNFGWGDGYATATATSDWNWDVFAANIGGSYIEITVTNNGDGTADVRYDVTYATGETHFQQYAGITADSNDLSCALTVDGCYLVFVE